MKEIVRLYIDDKYEKIKSIQLDETKELSVLKDKETGSLSFCKVIKRNCEIYKKLKDIKSKFLPEIYYIAYDENETVIIEEYVTGETFRQILNKEESIPEKEVINIFLKLCDALRVLHKNNIVHRDIKPENVMLDINGDIKLIDFDAARYNKKNASNDTVLLGTEGYAPPEQYGYMQTDKRADIYALGVMIYELLGNQRYKGKLRKILKKCVMFDPKYRYNTVFRLKISIVIKKYFKYLFSATLVLFMISTVNGIFNDVHQRYNVLNLAYNMFAENKIVKNMLDREEKNSTGFKGSWRGVYESNENNVRTELISDGKMLKFYLTDMYSEQIILQGEAEILNENEAVFYKGEYEMYITRYSNLLYIFDNSTSLGIGDEITYLGAYYQKS